MNVRQSEATEMTDLPIPGQYEAVGIEVTQKLLKPWILPSGNDFIEDADKRYVLPNGNPGSDFPFVKKDFNDNSWKIVNLPHDW